MVQPPQLNMPRNNRRIKKKKLPNDSAKNELLQQDRIQTRGGGAQLVLNETHIHPQCALRRRAGRGWLYRRLVLPRTRRGLVV